MADKFLENDDFEHVKECIRMTRLGQMLFNDGFMMVSTMVPRKSSLKLPEI